MNRFSTGPRESASLKAIVLLALAVCSFTGCAPFATFPPDGEGPNVYPWMAPCPEVMATSLREVHQRVGSTTPLVYNLPAKMSKMAWEDVQSRLGPAARRMTEGDTVVWNLERFGIRNTTAFSDIAFWNNGKSVLLTVSLERDNVMPFKFSHLQRFYVAGNVPPQSNYASSDRTPGQDESSQDEPSQDEPSQDEPGQAEPRDGKPE
jgi:hypothetical protein